jgi:uncharacterized membrane protein
MRLSPLLIVHICGGSVGLLAGTVAIVVRTGGPWHRVAGRVFVGGMLCLAASGAAIAYMRVKRPTSSGAFPVTKVVGTRHRKRDA